MGIFSGSTKTYVSSMVYNLAGDLADRPNMMASTVFAGIMGGTPNGWGSHLRSALLNSSAMQQRRFFLWARDNYVLGLPVARVSAAQEIDIADAYAGIRQHISVASNQTLQLLSVRIDNADLDYWAEEWVAANRPSVEPEQWSADFEAATSRIVITIAGESPIKIAAKGDFLWGIQARERKLLFAAYRITTKLGSGLVRTTPVRLFTYRMGSGTVALDRLKTAETELREFFPALPLRVANTPIDAPDFANVYGSISKGFRKLTGSRIEELLEKIEDQESIGDVDYCFLVQGVALNTTDKIGRRYIYEFFRGLIEYQNKLAWDGIYERRVAHDVQNTTWKRWHQANDETNPQPGHPLYGKPEPSRTVTPLRAPSYNEIRIKLPGFQSFDHRMRWLSIEETQHLGNAKRSDGNQTRTSAKVGEFWLRARTTTRLPINKGSDLTGSVSGALPYNKLEIFHQYAKRRYRKITVHGLVHENMVYKEHSVRITADEAMEDPEESGFLVPLHYPTLKQLGLARGTQLATTSSYLVFNSFTIVKQKWYETGFFKFILTIAAVVLTSVTAGASLGLSGGLLGANAALGVSLGASAATAALVGATVNALAATVLATIITRSSTKLFGEKLGTIIGTVVSFVALTYGTQFATTGNFNVDWGRIMRADNLTKLSDSVGNAYSKWMAADTAQLYGEMQTLAEQSSDQLAEIQKRSEEILGMTGISFDPMLYTNATEYFGESRDTFLSRTLLTGGEIANLSHAMIENYAAITLELPAAG